jgi:hypothetical protein
MFPGVGYLWVPNYMVEAEGSRKEKREQVMGKDANVYDKRPIF